MPPRKVKTYVDEYGTPALEIGHRDVTTFYVLAAVIVEADEEPRFTEQVRRLQTKYFPAGELKFSKLAERWTDRRKVQLFEQLSDLPFRARVLAVDKRRVDPDGGLAYGVTFVKFVHRTLYRTLFKQAEVNDVVADEQRGTRFMREFDRYLASHLRIGDLFNRDSFRFDKSVRVHGLQVADLVAGALGHSLDPKKIDPPQPVLDIVRSKAVIASHPVHHADPRWADRSVGDHDQPISELSTRLALRYLQEANETRDPETRERAAALEYLTHVALFESPSRWVGAPTLIRNAGLEGRTRHQLRHHIIGPLRDADVLIASGPHGYKLPLTEADLRAFAEMVRSQVDPQLSRLERGRNAIRGVSDVDLLDAPGMERIRAALGDDIAWQSSRPSTQPR